MKNKDNRPMQAAGLRRRAEKIAREKAVPSPENLELLSLEETRRMLYELRVHQIELEMQNEELCRTQVELEAARQRYFDLYDLAPVGYCTLSEKGLILEANLTAANLLGAARSTLVKKPITRFIQADDQDIYYHFRKKLFETGMPQNCQLRMLRPDGALFWAQLDSTATNDARGAPARRVVIIDITERRRADEALRQGQKLAALGLLVAGIAHEINNPNGFIIFNLPILREYLQELMPIVDRHMLKDPKRRLFGRGYEDFRKDLFDLLDNIEHGAQRINATVSELKDFARKREKPGPRRTDLKQVIYHAVSICQNDIRKNVKSLQIDIPENIPPVLTDPEDIEQILVNLLINAAQASDKEDSWIRLNMTMDEKNPDRCIIAITDNGCGMDAQSMEKIFNPFYTSKSRMDGTGLGLYICQNLAKSLGCRIEVESHPHQGSCFRLILNDRPLFKDNNASMTSG